MTYKKIRSYEMTETELRQLWAESYCNKSIYTFDNIQVKFYPEMFDHAFFESANRKKKDKSVLSMNRCEKMLWIREALEDADAILKVGWDTATKSYNHSRRVAIVKGNYVVVIHLYRENAARFITAFQNDNEENLLKILNGPDFKRA